MCAGPSSSFRRLQSAPYGRCGSSGLLGGHTTRPRSAPASSYSQRRSMSFGVTKQLGIVLLQPGQQQRATPHEANEGSQLEVTRTPSHPLEVQQRDQVSVVPQHICCSCVAVDHHQIVRHEGVQRAHLLEGGSHGVDEARVNEGKPLGRLH